MKLVKKVIIQIMMINVIYYKDLYHIVNIIMQKLFVKNVKWDSIYNIMVNLVLLILNMIQIVNHLVIILHVLFVDFNMYLKVINVYHVEVI